MDLGTAPKLLGERGIYSAGGLKVKALTILFFLYTTFSASHKTHHSLLKLLDVPKVCFI